MDRFFRFKQFTVANQRSAMKVGTDGVLLGAWVSLRGDERHILDVGTGTGVIALQLAQRTSGLRSDAPVIVGVEKDRASAEEAAANFKASPWAERLAAFCGDFRGLGTGDAHPLKFLAFPYDLIVSNPPYFVDSLRAPDDRRSDARHAGSLSYADLIAGAVQNLAADGRLALILPAGEAVRFEAEARGAGLHPARRCRVSTRAAAPSRRTLLEFSRIAGPCEETTLTIHEEEGYTSAYRSLTRDFYLNF